MQQLVIKGCFTYNDCYRQVKSQHIQHGVSPQPAFKLYRIVVKILSSTLAYIIYTYKLPIIVIIHALTIKLFKYHSSAYHIIYRLYACLQLLMLFIDAYAPFTYIDLF